MKNACEGVMYPVDAAAIVRKALADKLLGEHKGLGIAPEENSNGEELHAVFGTQRSIEVPHKAWSLCKDELDRIFSTLANTLDRAPATFLPKRIFVLAPLHKGPIIGEPFAVYTPCNGVLKGSDWSIPLDTPKELLELDGMEQSDDVCTEEHSLETIAPYLAVLYPDIPVSYLLAPNPVLADCTNADCTNADCTNARLANADCTNANCPNADCDKLEEIKKNIGRIAYDGIIFISNDKETHCAAMWL